MKAPLRKRPQKPSVRNLANSRLLIDVIDELDLVDGMLRCIPQLHLIVQMADAEDADDLGRDPIGEWLDSLGADRTRTGAGDAEASGDLPKKINEVPDAIVEAARWRLSRVRDLLDAVHELRSKRKGG